VRRQGPPVPQLLLHEHGFTIAPPHRLRRSWKGSLQDVMSPQAAPALHCAADLPPVFRTKSCLRDGLLGRGSHAQGAVYG
jgi:hypothetical protein